MASLTIATPRSLSRRHLPTSSIRTAKGITVDAPSVNLDSSTACNSAEVIRTDEAMKLSDGAQRAYDYFKEKTEGKGIISEDGLRRDPAPLSHNGSMFEFHFDRPTNCVNIP